MARTKNFAEVIQAKMVADSELATEVEQEVLNSLIAKQVFDLRIAAGLSQKQLADRLGTKQSVISRIEDADYEGHSLGLLKRIADALGKKLTIAFSDPEPVQKDTVEVTETISSNIAYEQRSAGRLGTRFVKVVQATSVTKLIRERG